MNLVFRLGPYPQDFSVCICNIPKYEKEPRIQNPSGPKNFGKGMPNLKYF